MSRKSFLVLMLALSVFITSALTGCAQKTETSPAATNQSEVSKETDFPKKSIEFVVPFAAGGNVDLSARIIGPEMEKALGQKVVVLNKDGGGATIGQTYVANSNPDGYTMIALTSSFVTNIILKGADFSVDSMEPIGMFTFDPEIMLVSASSDIESIDQLIEKSKEKPLIHSTPGHSTSHHIAGLIFENLTGAKFEYVHTNGSAEQTVQLAGGHAEVGLSTYGGAASLIEQGKIRVLAVAADERLEALPDVPTFKELGYDYTYGAWRGVAVPKGTPQEVKDILEKSFTEAMKSDTLKGQFENSGFPVTFMTAEEFGKYIQNDYDNILAMKDILTSK